jgi:hypothetical protein
MEEETNGGKRRVKEGIREGGFKQSMIICVYGWKRHRKTH